jgi:hypothetical protein
MPAGGNNHMSEALGFFELVQASTCRFQQSHWIFSLRRKVPAREHSIGRRHGRLRGGRVRKIQNLCTSILTTLIGLIAVESEQHLDQ